MGAIDLDKKKQFYHPKQKRRQNKQYEQLKEWITETSQNNRMIVAGDFNANYLELRGGVFQPEYSKDYLNLLKNGCGKNDFSNTFLMANHMDQTSPHVPTYSQQNSYVMGGLFAENPSEVEDFIFSCGFSESEMSSSQVMFTEPNSVLSDHYGIMNVFTF